MWMVETVEWYGGGYYIDFVMDIFFIFSLFLPTLLFSFNIMQVSEKKAKEWCASRGNMPYFETSAKEDYNVDAAFLQVAQLALQHDRDQDM